MDVTKRNDVSIYCLSAGATIPEWLGDRGRRSLSKTDENVRRRIELLQDFQMPASSSKIVQSADGRYVMVSGTYPPRIRCYDVHDLTMKFERYVNAEVIDMVMLGEDYGKLALLQEDRTIAFHAHYGAHESIRIPTFGRAMAYESMNCELLVAAKGNRIYRINLDEGRFSEPWTFDASDVSTSCITVNPSYPTTSVGCDDGMVRFWDSRASDTLLRPMLKLDVQSATVGYGYAHDDNGLQNSNPGRISSLAYDPTGMYLAAGTAGGLVALYDVRSSRPLHIQEHKDGLPIHTVRFHSESGLVMSGDERLVKAWRYKSMSTSAGFDDASGADRKEGNAIGAVRVNIEGSSKLTNFIVAGDESDPTGNHSGVILCTSDQPTMESYFVPAIGVAPKWCSFLDSITEELEERDLSQENGDDADELVRSGKESIYENYKFVTRDDLEKLGITNLIGTPLLRGYMHGFFMNINLYNRVKAVANPFEYEEYQKKKVKERLAAKRSSRIAPKESEHRPKAAVNPDLAERLGYKADDSTKAGKVAKNVLSDDRFGSLFTNPDYQIDEEDQDFKLRNPSGVASKQKKRENMDSDDEDDEGNVAAGDAVLVSKVDEDELEQGIADEASFDGDEEDDGASLESDSDDDGFRGGKVRGEAYDALKALERSSTKSARTKKKIPRLYETEGLEEAGAVGLATGDAEARDRARQRMHEMELPLAQRLAEQAKRNASVDVRVSGGSKEASFIPRDTKRKMEAEKEAAEAIRGKRNRRGVKDLKFKTPFKNK